VRAEKILRKVLEDRYLIPVVWFAAGVGAAWPKYFAGHAGNYQLYIQSFWHLLQSSDLYAVYPGQYSGFLYGPVFCVLIAPFSLLPPILGSLLFLSFSAGILWIAITTLPLSRTQRHGFALICLMDLINNQQHFQTNALIAALVILSFTLMQRRREEWSALSSALGFLVKLYGGMGLIFVVFAKRPERLLLAFLVWGLTLTALAAMLSSWSFVFESYRRWIQTLADQNLANTSLENFQGQGVAGLIRRSLEVQGLSERAVMFTGLVMLLVPYLKFRCHKVERFQWLALAAGLMFLVLFSSGAENPTFIIFQCGVAVWFFLGSALPMRLRLALVALVLLFSTLPPTSLLPGPVGDFWVLHSLRAAPGLIIWLVALYEMMRIPPPASSVSPQGGAE